MNVQEWLRNLEAAPKTKGHIKAVLHRLYEKAMLWEIVELQRNPMELVETKGISKRRERPVILTVEQFFLILSVDSAAVPHDGATRAMLGSSRRGSLGFRKARHSLRETQYADRSSSRSWSAKAGQDGILGGRAAA
jgi:hypothetical protein